MGKLSLADGNIRLVALTVKPANMAAPTKAELDAGILLHDRILKSDYKLGATGADEVDEAPLSSTSNGKAFGATNYEGSITPFRYLQADGSPDPAADVVFAAVKTKGTTLYLVEREGPSADTAFAAGDEVSVYEVVTGPARKPDNRTGYQKRVVQLGVLTAYEHVKATGS